MSRDDDIDALIEDLNGAMARARRLKAADVILLLSMAAIAMLHVPCDEPDESRSPGRNVH
jgi:hypothetical protein